MLFYFFLLIFIFYFSSYPATVVVWDSQVKDGYKRSQAPAADGSESGDKSAPRAAPVAWDGTKTSGVVEELLKNATDKAYGASGEKLSFCLHSNFIFLAKSFCMRLHILFVSSSPQLGWRCICNQ